MAWIRNDTNKKIIRNKTVSGVPTAPAIQAMIQNAAGSEQFYELEMAEVLDILLNEEDLPKLENDEPNFLLLGSIRARMINSQKNVHINNLPWIQPIDTNIKDYPLIGEYVVVANYAGKFYYFNRINILNSVNSNPFPGLSTFQSQVENLDKAEIQATGIPNATGANNYKIGNIFEENQLIRQLQPYEGDIIFNGRFGNTIRFGSDIRNDNSDSPNIKIRAGQMTDADLFDIDITENEETILKPVKENINADGSSIWLTTNEQVNFHPATEELTEQIYSTLEEPIEEFIGKQIFINSDRIILNSKRNEIVGFAKRGIEFSSERTFGITTKKDMIVNSPIIKLGINELNSKVEIETSNFLINNLNGTAHIDSKNIKLGRDTSKFESAVLGNTLKDLLSDFADIVLDFSKSLQKVGVPVGKAGTPIAPNVPSVPMIAAPDMTGTFIDTIQKIVEFKVNLRTALSAVVKVE